MGISFVDRMKAAERANNEKWAGHRETDERENLIEQFEKTNRKLNQDELSKVRKMYDEYKKEGKEFKIDFIQVILDCNEKLSKIKRIELEER